MSRTIRGKKADGFDFWSRRPHSGNGFGPVTKRLCHRTERLQGRAEVQRQMKELEVDDGQD